MARHQGLGSSTFHPITSLGMPSSLEPPTPHHPPPTPGAGAFKTTQWSLVLSADGSPGSASFRALEKLCQTYWFPVYTFVRRQAKSPEDAQDLTQEFFSRFLAKGGFSKADRERGRFRSFLLTSVKHFLTEDWRKANRQKRGGGQPALPIVGNEAESRYSAEPLDELSPDKVFDRRWAEALLERVMARLRLDYEMTGRAAVYQQLQQFLWGRDSDVSYAEMGERLGMNEGAVKVAVHRLRQRFREQLHAEVAETVESETDVDAEIRHLLGMFAA